MRSKQIPYWYFLFHFFRFWSYQSCTVLTGCGSGLLHCTYLFIIMNNNAKWSWKRRYILFSITKIMDMEVSGRGFFLSRFNFWERMTMATANTQHWLTPPTKTFDFTCELYKLRVNTLYCKDVSVDGHPPWKCFSCWNCWISVDNIIKSTV